MYASRKAKESSAVAEPGAAIGARNHITAKIFRTEPPGVRNEYERESQKIFGEVLAALDRGLQGNSPENVEGCQQ